MNITDNDIFAHYLKRNNRANLASLSLLITGESNPVIYSRKISDLMPSLRSDHTADTYQLYSSSNPDLGSIQVLSEWCSNGR